MFNFIRQARREKNGPWGKRECRGPYSSTEYGGGAVAVSGFDAGKENHQNSHQTLI